MSTIKIQATKKYELFDTQSGENRELNISKHKKLEASMRKYGFLNCFPIVVRREGGRMLVKEGQHRLHIAKKLDIPVWWVETEVDFDTALINCTPLVWNLKDYAKKHANNGLADYQEGLTFHEEHRLPVGTAFALLAGLTSFSKCQEAFISGQYKVKDRAWADKVAGVYVPMVTLSSSLKGQHFLLACMAVSRVPNFSVRRLLECADRCRKLLVNYGDRDAYLDMMEKVYNHGRQIAVGLKAEAINAMRKRNVVHNDEVRAKGRARSAEVRTKKADDAA